MNHWIGSGRLTKEGDLRYTQDGTAVFTTTIAVDDGYGEKKKTYFIDLVTFQKTAENAAQWTFKGQRVLVQGKMVKRSYDNKEGVKVYVTEVHVNNFEYMDHKPKAEEQPQKNPFADAKPFTITDDYLPF